MKKLKQKEGVVLIYFAFVTLIVFAILSLIIDIGLARVTQVQMQTAVDGGSLLGMINQDNTALTEQEKRDLVREQISFVFDDDYDLDNDERNLGAGPIIPLSGGATALNAQQSIDTESLGVYDPLLELNDQDNELHGDMVRGEYFPVQPHRERSDYTRDDFDHESADPDAFLVRMRRANDALDIQENVSSSAPPLPYLYGLATTLTTDSIGTGPRFEGITVRATAISSTSTVKGVGIPKVGILGVVPFALQKDFWTDEASNFDEGIPVTVDAGNILDSSSIIIGMMLVSDIAELQDFDPMFIGDLVNNQVSAGIDSDGYVPIYKDFSGENLIVGFGRASMSISGTDIQITKFSSQVAFENATALLAQGIGNTEVLDQLLTEEEESLLAPVIVR